MTFEGHEMVEELKEEIEELKGTIDSLEIDIEALKERNEALYAEVEDYRLTDKEARHKAELEMGNL